MRLPIAMAVLLVAGPSVAQPVKPAPPAQPAKPAPSCQVKIVRAPEDARRVIETWVRGEVACRISLDVRVIPTDGGLYLLARESTGLLHERLVPDAQAAGVLVASWVANDSTQPPSPLPPAPRASPAPKSAQPSTMGTVPDYETSRQRERQRWRDSSWWSVREAIRGTEIIQAQVHAMQ